MTDSYTVPALVTFLFEEKQLHTVYTECSLKRFITKEVLLSTLPVFKGFLHVLLL